MTLHDLVFTECPLAKGRPFLFEVQKDRSVIGWRCFPGYVIETKQIQQNKADLYMECTDSKAWRSGFLAFKIEEREDRIQSGYITATISFIAVLGFSLVDDNIYISYLNMTDTNRVLKEPYSNKNISIIYINQIASSTEEEISHSSYSYKELQLIRQKKNPDTFPGKLPADYDCLSVPSLYRFNDSKSSNKRKRRVSKVKKKYIPDHPRRHSPVQVLYAIESKAVPWESYCISDCLRSGSNGFKEFVAMPPDTFKAMMNALEENGKDIPIISYHDYIKKLVGAGKAITLSLYDMNLGSRSDSFILTLIGEKPESKQELRSNKLYMEVMESDVMDYNVEAPVVFRGYPWSFQPWLTKDYLQFLLNTFPSKGMSRNCTSHTGLFEMVGHRQTKQASSSMITTIGASNLHDYYRADMDRGTLPFVKSILNALTEEAIQCCYESGEFLQNSLTAHKDRRSICPYTILTMKDFSNCNHDDTDYLDMTDTECVLDSVCDDNEMKEYVEKLVSLMISKAKKERIPLVTTCAWSTLAENKSNSWELHQSFVMPDASCAFNIGTKVLKKTAQVGGTFQGSLINHLTSRGVWTQGEIMRFTPPQIENYTLAWGSSGGPPELRGRLPVHRPVNNTFLQNWLRRNPGRQLQAGRGRGGRGRGRGTGVRGRGTGGLGPGPLLGRGVNRGR